MACFRPSYNTPVGCSFVVNPTGFEQFNRGQDRLFRDFLLPLRPKDFNPKEYLFNIRSSPLSKIRDPLHRVLELRVRNFRKHLKLV